MKLYLFKGQRIHSSSKEEVLRKFKVKNTGENRRLVSIVKKPEHA